MTSCSRNMSYLISQGSALLRNTSPAVKGVCILVALGYILSIIGLSEPLTLSPGELLGRPWSIFTFWIIELHFWEIAVDAVALGLCGKLMEPLWGRREMLVFFVASNTLAGTVIAAGRLCVFAISADPDLLFAGIHGLAAYIAAVSVAVKQLMPDHLLISTRIGKLTNRTIPLLIFCLAVIFWAVGLLEGDYPCMWGAGTIVSWVYLRFWQRHSNGTRGDTADSFSFDNFFPRVLQPVIRAISTPIEKCLVKIGVCPTSRRRVHLALSPRGLTITLPGVEPQDMERRRQIALKALSERLSKTSEQSKQKTYKGFPPAAPQFQSSSVNIPMPEGSSAPIFTPHMDSEPTQPQNVTEAVLIDIDPSNKNQSTNS